MQLEDIYFGHSGISLGDRISIDQLLHGPQRDLIPMLQNDGFTFYLRSSVGCEILAFQAVKNCLQRNEIRTQEVEAIIVVTESFGDDEKEGVSRSGFREGMLKMVCENQLTNAIPYGVWMSGCANFAAAIDVAVSMLIGKKLQNILVVLVDRIKGATPRVSASGTSVFSDGAACLLVTRKKGKFRINGLKMNFSAELFECAKQGRILQGAKALSESLRSTAENFPSLCNFKSIITDNLLSTFVEFVTEPTAIDTKRIIQPSKANGHVFSADCAISLDQIPADGLHVGDRIGLLNLGPYAAGFVEIEVCC